MVGPYDKVPRKTWYLEVCLNSCSYIHLVNRSTSIIYTHHIHGFMCMLINI